MTNEERAEHFLGRFMSVASWMRREIERGASVSENVVAELRWAFGEFATAAEDFKLERSTSDSSVSADAQS